MAQPLLPSPADSSSRAGAGLGDDDAQDTALLLRRLRVQAARLKWVWGATFLGVVALAVVASRFIKPAYEVTGTIYLGESPQSSSPNRGPIREGALITGQGWPNMLLSYRVLDSVVVLKRLHVWGASPEDERGIAGIATTSDPQPGQMLLSVDPDGATYRLHRGHDVKDSVVASGTLPDSVGASLGLRWWREPFGGSAAVRFEVVRPRDAAIWLRDQLRVGLPEGAQLMSVTYTNRSASTAADVLNTTMDVFVRVADDLTRGQVGDYRSALAEQLGSAQARLREAERALEAFQTASIDRPREAPAPGGAGPSTADPMVRDYLEKRVSLENITRDREALQRLLARPSGLTVEELSAIPSVSRTPGPLRQALDTLASREFALRQARLAYSDEYAAVRALDAQVRTLRTQTIPALARSRLLELSATERDLERAVATFAADMRAVPRRAIEETRLRREFANADQFYTALLTRYNEVRLAQEGGGTTVRILDRAAVPTYSLASKRRQVLALGLVAAVGLVAVIIFVGDKLDDRIRFPEELAKHLRLDLLAVVPLLPKDTRRDKDALTAAQAVEAFRSLRLRLQHEIGRGGPMAVVVTSTTANEGKSLVSANLAQSFADGGIRTILVDGDMRRGEQHANLGLPDGPGLTDVLKGTVTLDQAVRSTSTPNLSLLGAGKRDRRVPELLDRQRLEALFGELRGRFDAVIVDSMPLAAGVDTFAIASVIGAAIYVVRQGVTERKFADAKLQVVDRLPISVVGAVLNAVPSGQQRFSEDYYYAASLPEYALIATDERKAALPPAAKR